MQTNVLKETGDKYLKQISKELGLFYDKRRILRCRGSLSNSTLPYSAKYPALHICGIICKGMSSTSTSPRSEIYAHGNQITDVDTARKAICEKDFTRLYGLQEQGQIGTYNFVVPGLSKPTLN